MKTELRRFTRAAALSQLPDLLQGMDRVPIEGTGIKVNLGPVRKAIAGMVQECPDMTRSSRASWDRMLAPLLHRSLSGIPRRLATDLPFWHWMTTRLFPEFVLIRWKGIGTLEPGAPIHGSLGSRFLGSRSLHGISRNALARLWWAGETLVNQDGDYAEVDRALERQDLFQAIFERRLGLHAPAARACLEVFADAPPDEFRTRIRQLNHHLSTLVLETLDQPSLEELLQR